MFIKELKIYKYGKWTNTHFPEMPSFTHFQGGNEAGKSTLTSFILSVLFGFPTKRDDRFRPVSPSSNGVGGMLLVQCPQNGNVQIERVFGNRAEVVVTLEDGTIKGEEWLKDWLGGVDRSLYEQIYFFNLDGLQHVHKIQPEDITRFLLSASTLGSEKLFQVENELSKQLDTLFKPQGKNPELNQQLARLLELEAKLREKKKGIDQYDQLLERQHECLEQENKLTTEMNNLQPKMEREKAFISSLPLLIKETQLQEKIAEYEDLSFPEKGLERWKEWSHALKPLSAQEISLKEKLESNRLKLSKLSDPILLPDRSKIEVLIEQAPLFNRDTETASELETKLHQVEGRIQEYREQLNIEDLSTFTWKSSDLKEAEILYEKYTQTEKLLYEKRNQVKEEQQKVTHSLEKEALLKREILSPQEYEREEGMVIEWETKKSIEKERGAIEEEMALLEQENQQQKNANAKKNRIERILFGVVAGLCLLGTSLSIIESQWSLAGLSALLFLFVGFGWQYIKRNQAAYNHTESRRSFLEKQLQKLKEKELDFTCTEDMFFTAKGKVKQHEQASENIRDLQNKLKEQTWYAEEIKSEQRKLEDQLDALENQLANLYTDRTGQSPLNLSRFSVELPIIQGIYHYVSEKTKLQTERDQLIQRIEPFQNELQVWADKLGISGTYQSILATIKAALEKEKDVERRKKHQQDILDDLQFQFQKVQQEKNLIHEELKALMKKASVPDEEAFFEKAYKASEREKVSKQLEAVQEQLALTPFTREERQSWKKDQFANPSEKLELLEEREKEIQAELEKVRKEAISLAYQIEQIEDGGSYIDLLHQYHQEKASFQEGAKKWAVYSLARSWLQEGMVQFKEGTFPKVLDHSEKHFKVLTDFNYERVQFSSDNQELLVQHTSGSWFPAHALSQGTKEQLYVALRFGLIEALYPGLALPIIIDDSFVNFDSVRVSKVIETLRDLSKTHQIIFLSCHPQLAEHFTEEEIIHLERIQNTSAVG
ncbi:AAA family ATPase [Bacillus carboniphilus]|uniref:AAA family ATPase n=1 Tax=Bacillus carboniphilus TaxID=86663 RepID=A0ABN0W828_9BACI